ncbi:MAG: S8 family serine peptidase [Candidatus Caldipriscus sp.]|nr:S8 family serine peptidase [Candidatus Caldipriscus sp.]
MVAILSAWFLVREGEVDALNLVNRGVQIYEYIPGYGYIAKVTYGHPIPTELKIAKEIFEGKLDEAKIGSLVEILVVGFPDADKKALELEIRKRGYSFEGFEDVPRFKVLVPESDVLYFSQEIASLPFVAKVEPNYRNYLWNRNTRWSIQTHVFGDSLVWAHGIHGEGEIVGVMDSGLDYYSCFFRDTVVVTPGPTHRKVVNYRQLSSSADNFATCPDEHGHHVSGTVAGDPDTTGIFIEYRGMAYRARITFGDAGGPSCGSCGGICYSYSLYNIFNWFYSDGARIITNSWGSAVNAYTTGAYDADRFMWDRLDALVLFAAGNSSNAGNFEDGTVGSPAVAKNIVTVGATGAFSSASIPPDENRAWYSSQGPTYDGRLKPDVMAPGGDNRFSPSYITSAKNRTDMTPSCAVVGSGFMGTSMATPAVAGAGALIRQYFREGWYPTGTPISTNAFNPKGSLIKAMLIASAERLRNEVVPPNGAVGWGRINLKRALFFDDMPDKHRLFVVDDSVGVQSGAAKTYNVTVGCSSQFTTPYFKVVLAWTDAPGSTLQNDLDLEVIAPNGTVYRGNQFSGGQSIPNPSGRDFKNNVEVVYVENAQRGIWTVRVIGRTFNNPKPGGYQPYSLVAVDGGPCGNNDPLGVEDERVVRDENVKAGFPYYVRGNVLYSLENLKIYDPAGKLLGELDAGKEIKLKGGIYFVSAKGKVYKVVIR